MQMYLVRRTRGFIRQHYAQLDAETGREYLTLSDGTRNYFPDRVPKVVKFECRENDPTDQYATLYSQGVVQALSSLHLPRYGLKNYLVDPLPQGITADEQRTIDGLSRAGPTDTDAAARLRTIEAAGNALTASVGTMLKRIAILERELAEAAAPQPQLAPLNATTELPVREGQS